MKTGYINLTALSNAYKAGKCKTFTNKKGEQCVNVTMFTNEPDKYGYTDAIVLQSESNNGKNVYVANLKPYEKKQKPAPEPEEDDLPF